MKSYDIGTILGRAYAGARKKANKPFSEARAKQSANSYFEAASLAFINLSRQDFVEGFCDGVEASFKGQLVEAAR